MKTSWIWSFLSLQLPYESIVLSSVLCLHMLFKTALIQIGSLLVFRTELTDEVVPCFDHIMSQLMLLQIRTTCKTLFTCWALIRLLPCMHSFMSNQIRYLRKSLWTSNIVTNVRLFMVMDPLMLLQRGVLDKCLRTVWAKLIFLTIDKVFPLYEFFRVPFRFSYMRMFFHILE